MQAAPAAEPPAPPPEPRPEQEWTTVRRCARCPYAVDLPKGEVCSVCAAAESPKK